MLNPSFGAIMSSAAKQSRLDREKDEANQLSMMQAGFIPKEQPAQPEPTGLQSMLANVRDQYAYQPEYAPTDYVPGPAHAASMQAAQHEQELEILKRQQEFGGRFDKEQRRQYELQNEFQNTTNSWLDRINSANVGHTQASTMGVNENTYLTQAQTAGQRQQTSERRLLAKYNIDSARLSVEEIRNRVGYDKEMRPYQLAMAELGVEMREMELFRGGSSLVTDANGDQYFLEYDPKSESITSKKWSTRDTPIAEKYENIRLAMQVLTTMGSNTDEYKDLAKNINTQFRLLSLENDVENTTTEGDVLNPSETKATDEVSDLPGSINVTPEEKKKFDRREAVKALVKRKLITKKQHKIWLNGPGEWWTGGLGPWNSDQRKEWEEIDKDINAYLKAGE